MQVGDFSFTDPMKSFFILFVFLTFLFASVNSLCIVNEATINRIEILIHKFVF